MPVKVIGPGLSLLNQAMLALSRQTVVVGIPEEAPARREPGSPSNAQLAYLAETGMPETNTPARPVIGPALERARPDIAAALGAAAAQALRDVAGLKATAAGSGAIASGLEAVGEIAATAIRAEFQSGNLAPLAPSTLRGRKGTGSQPLYDTKQLAEAVGYRLRPKRD